jgi:hypothetical protein
MKSLTKYELIEIYGGNDGNKTFWQSVTQPFKDAAEAFMTLYNGMRDSVRDWGHTDGCKDVCSQN